MRSRLLLTVSALLLGVTGAAACATGSTFVGGFGGDGSGAGPTTSSSTGGHTGSSSSGGKTTSSSSSSSTSSGSCSETPCKVTSPQCGCGSGQECTIVSYKVACHAAGTTAADQVCTSQFDCAAGALCLGICTKFCDSDSDCTAEGGICALELSDGTPTGSIAGVTMCTGNCSPITNSGCIGSGNGCVFGAEQSGQMRTFTFCTQVGTGGKNTACTSNFDCKATYGCINNGTSNVCLQYCDANNFSACGGAGCTPLQDSSMNPIYIGSTQLGVCL